MKIYKDFNLGYSYNSPFGNITREIEKNLNLERCSCSWSNINKFDDGGGRPFGDSLKIIEKFDEVLLSEIQILKPDVVVFFFRP